MLRLWSRMGERYFSRWGNNFGHEPTEDWSVRLEGVPENGLAEALKICFSRPTSWPPILGEFLEICKSVSDRGGSRQVSGRGDDCPGRRAWIDSMKKGIKPGDPGYVEYFKQRELFHTKEMPGEK
jgi:hypothetical protein